MAGETLRVDIVGDSASASRAFKSAADSAVLAARGAKQLADSLKLQSKSADVSAAATLALAKSDKILRDAELELAGAADEAQQQLHEQGRAAESAAVKTRLAGEAAKGAGGGFSVLASPMGAAVGAGIALAPVLVTVATGLGGLALAGYGVAKPIANAAQKTGGLAAHLKTLDPEQRSVARSILALGKQYDQFQNALKPEVLGIFGHGLSIASGLLHDIQPVTVATGKAFGILLGRIDAEFRSGTWQNFFGFMAKQAGPDVQLLGNLLIDLMNDLPPLLTALQPVATGFLKLADGAVRAAGDVGQLIKKAQVNTGERGNSVFDEIKRFVNWGGTHLPGHNKSVLQLAESWLHLSAGATTAAKGMTLASGAAAVAQRHIYSLAQQVQGLTDKENAALSPMLAYTNSLIAQRNDADAFKTALKASHDVVGLHTAAERASFGAANTYIQDLLNTASAAVASHHGIDDQISSIKGALPLLTSVKGGTKDYWQEVKTLQHWLAVLEKQKLISENIIVTGLGKWTTTLPTGKRVTGLAGGGRISAGTTPTADDVLIRASRNETVVSAAHSRILAPAFAAVGVPGYAGGGIIPSYSGAPGGLQPWGQHNRAATIAAITAGIADAMSRAFTPAGALSTSAGIRAEQLYALSLFPNFGWGPGQLSPLIALWNRESGWNANARNPSSGAYGIAQALPPSKMGFLGSTWAGQILWGENYIKGRYGNPGAAWAHEVAAGWYDQGGYLSPGLTLALNTSGHPEQVIPARGGAGGNVTLVLENRGVIGSQAELDNWLHHSVDRLAMQGRLSWALRQSPSAP